MAIINKKEISAMNADELKKRCGELRLELLKANALKSSKTAPRKVKEIRRTIARLLTSLSTSSKKDAETLKNAKKQSIPVRNKINREKNIKT